MATKTALVVGARGVIGGNLVRHLGASGDWDVIGLSRRGGADSGPVRHVAVDLLDRDDARAKLGELSRGDARLLRRLPGPADAGPSWSRPNLAMLTNVVDAIEPVAAGAASTSA